MLKLYHLIILFLIALSGQGQEWLGPQQYFNDVRSFFADPVFYPWTSEAERISFESRYYPYFGEEFFRFGTDPHQHSAEAIAAQRQKFERQFYPDFGERFLSWAEPYPAAQEPYYAPPGVPAVYPYISEFRNQSLAGMQWDEFQKNWTRTQEFVESRSSLRIFKDGEWVSL